MTPGTALDAIGVAEWEGFKRPPSPPIGWAVVELLGHRRELGHLSEADVAAVRFLRLATPIWDPATEDWRPEDEEGAATVVFISTQAIYAITPTTEQAVRDEIAPWVGCRAPVDDPGNRHDGTCALRKGHAGEHDPDDGLPF